MARELKGIVAAYIAILVYSTGALAKENYETECLISWKGVKKISSNSYSDPNVTSDCEKYSICKNVDNYPTELAQWALEKLGKNNSAIYTIEKMSEENEGEMQIVPLCPSQKTIMFPTAALSKKVGWHFILNLPDKHFQGYYVNKCGNSISSCQKVSKPSACEQGYTERSMIYLDLKKQSVCRETFTVPSCCYCTVEF